MSTRSILRHAPYLRRYARALTGSQTEGDGFVRAALDAVTRGEVTLDAGQPLRVALFRAFHEVWRRALNGHSIDAPGARLAADVRLQKMTPEHRTALLLVLMEGFSLADVAFVLGLTPAAAQARFEAAQESIERQLATNVLIIEDEPIIALDLERVVIDLGHRVVGIAPTHATAVSLANAGKPGLVLADVRLADGSSGIDAVAEILETYSVPVVFITAFPERLLTGARPEPTFLITKPFRPEAVKAMVSQALFFHQPKPAMHPA